jgi:hypothetical protein
LLFEIQHLAVNDLKHHPRCRSVGAEGMTLPVKPKETTKAELTTRDYEFVLQLRTLLIPTKNRETQPIGRKRRSDPEKRAWLAFWSRVDLRVRLELHEVYGPDPRGNLQDRLGVPFSGGADEREA